MRYKEFGYLIEGYPQAQTEFSKEADPAVVQKAILDFRSLVNRSQIKVITQKNIDYWIKQGWEKFRDFVNQTSSVPSKTQVTRKKLPGESITLIDNESWFIIIPIDKESSCFHGRDSNWCTTKIHQSHFERYFYENEITLIYCFNKSTGGMWAIAANKRIDEIEIFNQSDDKISREQFKEQTGLDPTMLRNLALGGKLHQPRVQAARDKWKASVELTDKLLKELPDGARSPEVEKELLYNKYGKMCGLYIKKIGAVDGKDFPLAIQLSAAGKYGSIVQYIKNPAERVQLASVSDYGGNIEYIIDAGIIPSEAVQIAAVRSDGFVMRAITKIGIKPSAAVKQAFKDWENNIPRLI